jgi:hypothetical protein
MSDRVPRFVGVEKTIADRDASRRKFAIGGLVSWILRIGK